MHRKNFTISYKEDKDITMINILLVDNHKMIRAGFRSFLEESGDIKVVDEADNGKEVLGKVADSKPDVLVLDISMPGIDGLEVADKVHFAYPKLPILILTKCAESQYALRAIRTGVMGYINKSSDPEKLEEAIRQVYSGKTYFTDEIKELQRLRIADGLDNKSQIDLLSKREFQILICIALGRERKQIALNYNISAKTVDTYCSKILKKLNLKNRIELTHFAIKHGLIKI